MKQYGPIDGETLLSTPLPPVRWLIPNLLPAGMSLLAGASKAGKSWLCLWMCLQLAKGGEIWNRTVPPQTVLYLCLEDTFAHIQARLFRLTEDAVPERLYFQTGSETIGNGLKVQIEKFLAAHQETALVAGNCGYAGPRGYGISGAHLLPPAVRLQSAGRPSAE